MTAKTIGELTSRDLGRYITVSYLGGACTGILVRFDAHPSSEVEEWTAGSKVPEILYGPTVVDLTVGPWETTGMDPETLCVVRHA